uniref:Uncharacterized protein n=2 Tax=Micrurus TaxID=8634 RepID=A0A2D4FSA6_MICCO
MTFAASLSQVIVITTSMHYIVSDPFCSPHPPVKRLERKGLQENKQAHNENKQSCLHSKLEAPSPEHARPDSATTLLSICIPHCMPAYSFAIPSSPMNVNTNRNTLLGNYSRAEVSIPKSRGVRKRKAVT